MEDGIRKMKVKKMNMKTKTDEEKKMKVCETVVLNKKVTDYVELIEIKNT